LHPFLTYLKPRPTLLEYTNALDFESLATGKESGGS
jgi:hypothetical protein